MDVLLTMMLLAASPEILPEHVDIPPGHSTVICPDQASAQTMIDGYYRVQPAPNNHTIDIGHFFEGLRATGCVQDGERNGSVTIKSVKSRLTVELADGTEMRQAGQYRELSARMEIMPIPAPVLPNGHRCEQLTAGWMHEAVKLYRSFTAARAPNGREWWWQD